MNEGNNSGRGIGCVSWDGEVYADQFWRHHSFGNVRRRPFSEIWTRPGRPPAAQLKEKKKYVRAAVPAAPGWMSAAAISACGPKRFPAMYGRLTRRAT
jgi:MoaA/NifB/PqqE/SkfB family radical SAM enzyme